MPRRQAILSDRVYLNPKDMQPGEKIRGTYMSQEDEVFRGKTVYKYLIEREGDGVTVCVNGRGGLNKQMAQGQPGEFVEIVYRGKAKMTSGEWAGNDCHQFDVWWGEDEPEEFE